MNFRARNLAALALSPLVSLSLLLPGCAEQEDYGLTIHATGPTGDRTGALLDLAATAVQKFPLDPHIKNRSRAQEKVVQACLTLDELDRGLAYAGQIENWRRGTALADHAYHCVLAGRPEGVEAQLEQAVAIARTTARDANAQAWRIDRIRAKVARAYLALGDVAAARSVAARVVDSEAGILLSAQAAAAGRPTGSPPSARTAAMGGSARKRNGTMDLKAVDAQLATLDTLLADSDFDRRAAALDACQVLFDLCYRDGERAAALEHRIKKGCETLPVEVQIQRRIGLIEAALDHEDRDKAQVLLREVDAIFAANKWLPENRVPMRARLAGLRHRCGDIESARAEVGAAMADYEQHRKWIVDIYRARTLRPIAEAYQVLGDPAAALAIYKLAVAAGKKNPNSRPRAEDLAATCCSMAVHGVVPDAVLWTRMTKICDQLGNPW